jgi:hypothetical protein
LMRIFNLLSQKTVFESTCLLTPWHASLTSSFLLAGTCPVPS